MPRVKSLDTRVTTIRVDGDTYDLLLLIKHGREKVKGGLVSFDEVIWSLLRAYASRPHDKIAAEVHARMQLD